MTYNTHDDTEMYVEMQLSENERIYTETELCLYMTFVRNKLHNVVLVKILIKPYKLIFTLTQIIQVYTQRFS